MSNMSIKRQWNGAHADAELPSSKRRPKMSDEQLQRKRASDREAQRALREKTKNHVAHLENLVESLQGEQEGRVDRLIAQIDEQRSEITRLRNALSSISRIADTAKEVLVSSNQDLKQNINERQDTSSPTPSSKTQPGDDDLAFQHPNEHEKGLSPQVDTASATGIDRLESFDVPASILPPLLDDSAAAEHLPEMVADSQALSIAQMASGIVRKKELDGRFWFLAGTLLSYILKNQDGHPIYTAYDEDIAIRAVFEGWSAVIERYPLDRGWQWLKELDENIYFHLSAQHRLMHLRNSRLQLLHQLDPHSGWNLALPTFFAPRPSQQHIEHDPLLEHFPWPGFRERILFSPRKFATNRFMEALRKNVNFLWPYDTHDLYVKDTTTGLFSYSSALNRQMMDIRCYTADKDFFTNFPELRQDIPQNHSSPVALPTCLTLCSDSPAPDDEDEARIITTDILTT